MLCSTAISYIAQFDRRHYPSWDFCAFKTSVDVAPNGTSCGVWPDGIIRYVLDRRHYIPYIWIEVKQLHQAPQTSEEPETAAYLSTLPQKTAEAIAMAKFGHREVFGIEFSHRFAAFWHVVVPDDYLELIKNTQEIPPHVRFVMKRSRVLDLALPDDRFEFFRAFLALMLYLDEQARSNA
ncbi:hypothetical protein IWQ62_003935 [Dispira parvispora]|uniref:Uncharacterized protein n=1 Tax=Dispira parvispora TaxID=1520584 RepID=A0A9W8ATC1_9FUNG|nr:hypothetical protein IWQ62_003935 [Dispira parvispora]